MLARGRLTIVEGVELGIAELLAGSRERAIIVDGSIAKLDTVAGLGQGGDGKQEQDREGEKEFHGDTSLMHPVYARPVSNQKRLFDFPGGKLGAPSPFFTRGRQARMEPDPLTWGVCSDDGRGVLLPC